MDKKQLQVDVQGSKARKKRIQTLKTKKNVPNEVLKVKPLSDITNSSLNKLQSSKHNVYNHSNNQNVSSVITKPHKNDIPSHKLIVSPQVCGTSKPTNACTPTQRLPCKPNADQVQTATPLTDIANNNILPQISSPSHVSYNSTTPNTSHVGTTSTRWLHDHSGYIKSKRTIKATIQSIPQSNSVTNTQPSDLSASLLSPNVAVKSSLPATNLLHKFSDTLEPHQCQTHCPQVGTKRTFIPAENPNNSRNTKKKSQTSSFVSTSNTQASELSASLLIPNVAAHRSLPTTNLMHKFSETLQPQQNQPQSPQVGTKRNLIPAANPENLLNNKKRSQTSSFVSTSKPVNSILSGLLDRLQGSSSTPISTSQSTQPNHSPSATFIHDSQIPFHTKPSNASLHHGHNNAKPISTDAEYFDNMSTSFPQTTQSNDSNTDHSSDSDSDKSDDSEPLSTSDEEEDDNLEDQLLNGIFHDVI
jgi:hypothetical protein